MRGYLAGSGWKDYGRTGAVCGIPLPAGLRESERLPEPMFTPSTKAEVGHDENISFDQMVALVGPERAEEARTKALELYRFAASQRGAGGHHPRRHEVRVRNRRWRRDDPHRRGADARLVALLGCLDLRAGPRAGLVRQAVRARLSRDARLGQDLPGPELPAEVVAGTRKRYVEAFERITGGSFERYLTEDVIG